jgi:predicted HTH domain antitoxin
MKTLTLTLPDNVDFDRAEIMMMIAAKLYERGTLSLGRAAELAGVKKWDFPKVLADNGVCYFNLSSAELAEDVKNA